MNIFKEKIKHRQSTLIYQGIVIFTFTLLVILELLFLNIKTINNNKRTALVESKISFSETQQNKLIFENSLITKADAMYHVALIKKNFSFESYVSDLKHLMQSTSNYYGLFNPIRITVSYDNAVVGATTLVPLNISITMKNIFDYTPVRMIFILFNNTQGTMNCNGLSISREFSGDMFKQFITKGFLFNSNITLQWFVLLKPTKPSFHETFVINYQQIKNLEKIEHMYNMSVWDESFMILPNDIDKLKDMQHRMR